MNFWTGWTKLLFSKRWLGASKNTNVSRVRVLLKTTLTCRICTVSCHFWLFPYSITFFYSRSFKISCMCTFSQRARQPIRTKYSRKNKNGTYSYQTSSRSISNPLLWLVRKYFLPIRYGVLRISCVLVLSRSCNLFYYCSELAAPESPKMAETWIDKRSLSHYQLNNNITVSQISQKRGQDKKHCSFSVIITFLSLPSVIASSKSWLH